MIAINIHTRQSKVSKTANAQKGVCNTAAYVIDMHEEILSEDISLTYTLIIYLKLSLPCFQQQAEQNTCKSAHKVIPTQYTESDKFTSLLMTQ